MTFLEAAISLARQGFHVFPLVPNGKKPLIKNFPEVATRNEEIIRAWWYDSVLEIEQPYNIGISTTRFGDNESLIAIDVDNKEGKDGNAEIEKLKAEGKEFPATYTQRTPTGGYHFVFKTDSPRKQGVENLGHALDTRSHGGYIVGVGSVVPLGAYTTYGDEIEVSQAPRWLEEKLPKRQEKVHEEESPLLEAEINESRANARALDYLTFEAPPALEGQGGDQTTFRVAARLKDFGVTETDCYHLLSQFWNPSNQPPWSESQLKTKVANAYKYGEREIGESSPEKSFSEIQEDLPALDLTHPFEKLNEEYAFVLAGGGHHILWETFDQKGRFKLEHLSEVSFHRKMAARKLTLADGKTKPLTELWMGAPERRSYKGLCFQPGRKTPQGYYNLWRGFAVEPSATGNLRSQQAVQAFLSHARYNICAGDESLYEWLIGFFAHLVQKPWEKPLVALVFRGAKGVGKNALVDRVGYLLGTHYLVAADRRYLVGNFNSHLENCLLFTLDEAFWSGDKQVEGVLKSLITASHHVIEHKGKEPYQVENCTRIVIIGNEDWIVPASHDERRYAVFNVGSARKQDNKFFKEMREGMEQGGYSLLLHFLKHFDLSDFNPDRAPVTAGLHEQKLESLDPFYEWWRESLLEGKIVGADFTGEWELEVPKNRFRDALLRYLRDRRVSQRAPDERRIGKYLKRCAPSVVTDRRGSGEERLYFYRLPELEKARKEWENYLGHKENWEAEL